MNVFILTRTSNRPIFFKQNHQSVTNQTYTPIKHVVSYDTAETFRYLQEYDDIEKVPVVREQRMNLSHFPYNLYCNEMHKFISTDTGWVIYLDDDDLFTNNNAVSEISKYFNNPDNLIIWKTQFPSGVKPGRFFGKAVRSTGFPAICFAYHTKWLKHAIWDNKKGSDSRVLYKLSKIIPNKVWIDNVLTKINYNSGFGGMGYQIDNEK